MTAFLSIDEVKAEITRILEDNGPMWDLWLSDLVNDEKVIGTTYSDAINQMLEAREIGRLNGNRLVLTYGEEPVPANITTWNYAVSWAREHGAKIRPGKVTKIQARARIMDAGLRKEFNRAWPTYAFSEGEGLIAKEELVSPKRTEFYAKRNAILSRIEGYSKGVNE